MLRRDSGYNRGMKTFLVSTGHDEYRVDGDIPGLTVEDIWPPTSMSEDERYGLYDLSEDQLLAVWNRYHPEEPPPADDLTWESIVLWAGDEDAISRGLDELLDQLTGPPWPGAPRIGPSGDDDTFDYWPSGCRYAAEVASQCGRYEEFCARIRGVLELMEPTIVEEITYKLGIDSGED